MDMFLPPGTPDSPPSLQAGVFLPAFRTAADAGAAVDESEGRVGRGGGENPKESAGWSGGWLHRRRHR